MSSMESGMASATLADHATWLLERAEPGDWSAEALRRLAAARGWEVGPAAPDGGLPLLTGFPAGDGRLVPFGDFGARFADGRQYRELVIPVVALEGGTPGRLAEAFRSAGGALTAALGPANSVGSHGLIGPWFRPAPRWGAPFLRWRRPGASSLELRASESGAELVLMPTGPYEDWRHQAHEWSDPGTVGGFVIERHDAANVGLYTPGAWKAPSWKALHPALATFLAPLPTEVAALDSPMSFMILVGAAPQISVVCRERLRLRTGFRHATDPAALGWRRQDLPVQPWTLDAGGPGEVDGDRLATTLIETLRAERVRSPARLALTTGDAGSHMVLFGLGLG